MAGLALGLVAAASALAAAPTPARFPAREIDAVRQACIAAASKAQQSARASAQLAHTVELLRRELAGRQRGLKDTRREQAVLLGEIERVALHPPAGFVALPESPVDRVRSKLLRDAVAPALRREAAALSAAVKQIAALPKEIAARQKRLAAARDALAADRARLGQLVQQRLELMHRLLPQDVTSAPQLAKLGREAKDIADLIRQTDAAVDRYNRRLLVRARLAHRRSKAVPLTAAAADPTRPPHLRPFDPPASRLTMPVVAPVSRQLGSVSTDKPAPESKGVRLEAVPGGAVVAPFDGQVTYAATFGARGLILIIRHGHLYHSLLAGLGRIDVRVDDWVLAGEPVGVMPDKPGVALDLELRRDGRPVDPQPWLATRNEEHGGHGGDKKVSE